jgi:hypothetical protein
VIEWSLIIAFATWRVTSLLYIEQPFAWLRKWLHVDDDEATGARTVPDNIIGALFGCFWCLSMLVAFVFAAITYALTDLNVYEALVVWLASAAGALCVDVRFFARLRG